MTARKQHWTETADRVSVDSWFLLGENEHGDWCVRPIRGDLWRRVRWRNPLAWLGYIGSRVTGRLVWLEAV